MEQIYLPDGRILSSGDPNAVGIASFKLTRSVSDTKDIAPGAACAAMVEVRFLGDPELTPGMALRCCRGEIQLGIFYCGRPVRRSPGVWEVTAYDAMTRFDRDIAGWLTGRTGDTAESLLQALCEHCGVPVSYETLPGADRPIPPLSATGITGRQLLRFLGQLTGRWFSVDAYGVLRPGWYVSAPGPENWLQLRYEDYTTAPVQRIQLRQSAADTGSVWPDGSEEEANTFILEGNPLLSGDCRDVAQRLFEQLSPITHTPFTCKLLPGEEIAPGSLITFPDAMVGAVMQAVTENGICTVSGTGSPSLQSAAAFNELSLRSLNGRLLTVSRTAEGLQVRHGDTQGSLASLELSLGGIRTRVESVESRTQTLDSRTSQLTQTAEGLSLSVNQMGSALGEKTDRSEFEALTEHFRLDSDGLTVTNSATGMGITVSEKQVAFTEGTAIDPEGMTTGRLRAASLALGGFSFLPRTNGNLSFRYTGG